MNLQEYQLEAFAAAKCCKWLALAIYDEVGEDVGQPDGEGQRNDQQGDTQ